MMHLFPVQGITVGENLKLKMFQKIMILRKKWNIPCFRHRIPE